MPEPILPISHLEILFLSFFLFFSRYIAGCGEKKQQGGDASLFEAEQGLVR